VHWAWRLRANCRNCGYELAGLQRRRGVQCPECGVVVTADLGRVRAAIKAKGINRVTKVAAAVPPLCVLAALVSLLVLIGAGSGRGNEIDVMGLCVACLIGSAAFFMVWSVVAPVLAFARANRLLAHDSFGVGRRAVLSCVCTIVRMFLICWTLLFVALFLSYVAVLALKS